MSAGRRPNRVTEFLVGSEGWTPANVRLAVLCVVLVAYQTALVWFAGSALGRLIDRALVALEAKT